MIRIVRMVNSADPSFPVLCHWYEHWLGERNGESAQEICCTFAHSLNTVRLPQTFVAMVDNEPAGMYQLAMCDDLNSRPDLYPWLINVYVAEPYRGRGVCRAMMESVAPNAIRAGLQELYLYTKYKGLYEKFGWEYVQAVHTFREDSPLERLYRLQLV